MPRLPLIAATLIVMLTAQSPARSEDSWTVSCSKDGKVLHLERVANTNSQRESELLQRYPGATCIYISDGATADIPVSTGNADDSLEAALRAITGDAPLPDQHFEPNDASVAPALELGLAPAPAEPPRIEPFASPPQYRPASRDWVRLAIYETDDVSEALADWDRISQLDPIFRYVTPAITNSHDGYVMLSAGPIVPADRNEFCLAATNVGMDCLPGNVETTEVQPAGLEGLRYLAEQFPGVGLLTETSSRRPTFPRPAGYFETAGRWELSCRRGLLFEPEFAPYQPTPSVFPPLPRRRPQGS